MSIANIDYNALPTLIEDVTDLTDEVSALKDQLVDHGQFTLNGNTDVIVAFADLRLTDLIVFSPAVAVPNVEPVRISALTMGAGFSVVSEAGNTDVYNYCINRYI